MEQTNMIQPYKLLFILVFTGLLLSCVNDTNEVDESKVNFTEQIKIINGATYYHYRYVTLCKGYYTGNFPEFKNLISCDEIKPYEFYIKLTSDSMGYDYELPIQSMMEISNTFVQNDGTTFIFLAPSLIYLSVDKTSALFSYYNEYSWYIAGLRNERFGYAANEFDPSNGGIAIVASYYYEYPELHTEPNTTESSSSANQVALSSSSVVWSKSCDGVIYHTTDKSCYEISKCENNAYIVLSSYCKKNPLNADCQLSYEFNPVSPRCEILWY